MSTPHHDEALADAAERDELRSIAGTQLTGPAAAEAGRAALLRATGASTLEVATRMALGRPRVGEARTGSSRQISVRLPDEFYAVIRRYAEEHDMQVSDLARRALAQYVSH